MKRLPAASKASAVGLLRPAGTTVDFTVRAHPQTFTDVNRDFNFDPPTEVRKTWELAAAVTRLKVNGRRTVLFVDEIHRFNKAQQDAFLPYVERGTIRLIGATTENPSFEIISALLSRCRVYVLHPLSEARAAHEMLAGSRAHRRGKIVLQVAG